MNGNVAGMAAFIAPLARLRSIGLIPAAWILISTCPGPGCGSGMSVRAGAPPYSLTVTARMWSPFS